VDRVVIDANYGLGESVVSGEADVDHFEIDKASLRVVGQRIGDKREAIVAAGSGTASRAVSAEASSAPCLTEAQAARVADLVRRVEAHYGWPQDTEWGLHGEGLYLLQSRPVTAAEPRWTRDESAERFPNPMSPLTWDFISVAFKGSLAHSLSLMGLPPIRSDWFALFDHYVYGNQTAVDLIGTFRPLKARSVPELVQELPSLAQRYEWVVDLPVTWARDLDRYLVRLGRLSATALDDLDVPDLWAHIVEILDLASEYFRPNIAISLTQTILHRVLHGLVSMVAGRESALKVVDGLLAGCETKTALVNREIHELARLASDVPDLRALLLSAPGRDIVAQRHLEAFPGFAARFARFIEDHGHRELDMDYMQPTWSGQPGVVLDSIALIVRAGIDEDPAATARDQQARQFEAEYQFLAAVPVDLRFFFRELIRLARAYTTLDDVEHYETTRLNPVARRVACALGRRLVAIGALDEPEDVFFLRKSELEAAVAQHPRVDAAALRGRAHETKQGYERAWASPPAWTRGATTAPPPAGDVLRGLPGSPGQVTGPCFVVTGPEDFGRFPAGAVLVARTTNPAWTPLFYSASGLVTEAGGPLSHGAVTAREMRLPAVMGVRDATRRLRNGQVVAVDGTAGTVASADS
jgi:pyruvate,water dikinase